MCCGCCAQSLNCVHLQPHGLLPTRLLCPRGFSRQEYWNGLPCFPAGNLPYLGIKPRSPALQADSLPAEPLEKPESWSGQPIPSPGDLPNPGIKTGSPSLQADSLPAEVPGKPQQAWGFSKDSVYRTASLLQHGTASSSSDKLATCK